MLGSMSKAEDAAVQGIEEGGEDSDDEPIRLVRSKKKMNRSVVADSGSSDDDEPLFSALVKRSASPGGSRASSRSASPLPPQPGSAKRTRARVESSSDDSPASSRANSPTRPAEALAESSDGALEKDDQSVAEDPEKNSQNTTANKAGQENCATKKVYKLSEIHSDLFDAESDSDAEKENKNSDESSCSDAENEAETEEKPDEGGDGEDDDEPIVMTAALKRKLKQGAAKKPSKSRPARAAKPDMSEIYGESQRLVRESEVRLPYHKPQPLDLKRCLAKVQQVQSQIANIRKTPGKSWKNMHVMHSKSQPPVFDLSKSSPLKERPVNFSLEKPESAANDELMDFDDDDLPDLSTRVESVLKERSLKSKEDGVKDIAETNETDIVVTTVESATAGNSAETERTNTGDKKTPEQDSGYLTTPGMSEEENSSELSKEVGGVEPSGSTEYAVETQKDADSADLQLVVEDSVVSDDPASVQLKTNEVKLVEDSAPASVRRHRHTGLSQELRHLGVAELKPELSGGPDFFIDLNEDDASRRKSSAGVDKLMNRLLKHSGKRHGRKGRDVKLSMVEKEMDETTGKEELKLRTLDIHVDEPQDDDSALKQSGAANRSRLKETLMAGIRRKRADLRREKSQLHDLDNEEGFDMDDEAELTDQTDTDEDEIDEEAGDAEDELGEEADDEAEAAQEEREKNPFVADEAEEDEDEDNMHLALDDPDSDTEDKANSHGDAGANAVKRFLNSSLQKTKTMDLFDDDAFNDESGCGFLDPVDSVAVDDSLTLSQMRRHEKKIEISDRPFKSLSQEKRASDSVEDLLKQIGATKDDSIEAEDPALEKDSSLEDGLDSTLNNDDLGAHEKETGSSLASHDASFDSLASSFIQPGQRLPTRDTPDMFTPSSKGSTLTCSTANKSSRRLSDMSMPIEDTQDLLRYSPTSESTPRNCGRFDDSSYSVQQLDENGFLKSEKKPAKRNLELGGLFSSSQNNDDELMGLCSGTFGGSEGGEKSRGAFAGLSQLMSATQPDDDELAALCSGRFAGDSNSALFSSDTSTKLDAPLSQTAGFLQTQTSSQDNVNELMGLCSGQFPKAMSSPKNPAKKKKRALLDDSGDEDEFEMVSDDGGAAASEHDTDELASDAEEKNIDSDDEEEQQRRKFKAAFKQHKGMRDKKGRIRKNFVDEEAELSGSDVGSDEDADLDERDDVLEEELGDQEDLPSDDELRNQVGRVHLKNMIDDDKRKLRLYQERYLVDGDLHAEGPGRQRRFRWKNTDDDDAQPAHLESDGEADDAEEEADHQWRMQRFEREKFLSEQSTAQDADDSQLLKLGKTVVKPKKVTVVESPAASASAANLNQIPATTPETAPDSVKHVFKVPSAKRKSMTHGSFLTRSVESKAKMAEMTRQISNPGGARNSKNFVFSTVEKESGEDSEEAPRPQPVKRSNSVPSSKTNKRPKLERSVSSLPKKSVFHHLE